LKAAADEDDDDDDDDDDELNIFGAGGGWYIGIWGLIKLGSISLHNVI
jgi:hypothetical protein